MWKTNCLKPPQRLQKSTISMQIFVDAFSSDFISLSSGFSCAWYSQLPTDQVHLEIPDTMNVLAQFWMWYLTSSSLSLFLFSHFPLKDSPSLPLSTREIRTQPSTIGWLFRKCLIWLLSPRIEPVCCFLPIHLDPCKASRKTSHRPVSLPHRLLPDRPSWKTKQNRALCQIILKIAEDLTSLISSHAKSSALPIGKAWDTEVTQTSLSRHRSKHAYVILGWW